MANEFKIRVGLIVSEGIIKFSPLTTAGLVYNSSAGLIGTSTLGNGISFTTNTVSL